MADVQVIPNPSAVTIPAQAEKVFNQLFCTNLSITAIAGGVWTANFNGLPYDGVETLSTDNVNVALVDLIGIAALDPDLTTALGAVVTVIGKYLVKSKIKSISVVTPQNVGDFLS